MVGFNSISVSVGSCSISMLKRLESSEETCVSAVIWSSRGRCSTRFSCTRTCPAQPSLEQRQRVKPLIATMFSHMVSRVSIPNTFKCALSFSLRIKNDMEHFTAFMPLRWKMKERTRSLYNNTHVTWYDINSEEIIHHNAK